MSFTKKYIALLAAIIVTVSLAVSLYGCGNNDTGNTTTTVATNTSASDTTLLNDGKVSDVSESGDNGAAGEAVSDISEGLTDLSESMK